MTRAKVLSQKNTERSTRRERIGGELYNAKSESLSINAYMICLANSKWTDETEWGSANKPQEGW